MKKLGIRGPKTHLTMKLLAAGQKKSEASEFLDITTTNLTTTTNFIENWKITNYITFPPANSL